MGKRPETYDCGESQTDDRLLWCGLVPLRCTKNDIAISNEQLQIYVITIGSHKRFIDHNTNICLTCYYRGIQLLL